MYSQESLSVKEEGRRGIVREGDLMMEVAKN